MAKQVRFALFILIALAWLVTLTIWGYQFPWTGFSAHRIDPTLEHEKTLWDWLQLLIVPAVFLIGGSLYAWAERKNERKIADERNAEERKRADDRASLERELAEDNSREEILQAYFDRMSELLLHEELSAVPPEPRAAVVARARTQTILKRLDGKRKADVVRFLYEAGLIIEPNPAVSLADAVLSDAKLAYTNLVGSVFERTDIRGASFTGAQLVGSHFHLATLNSVDFSWANLSLADFHGAGVVGHQGSTNNAVGESSSTLNFNNANLFGANFENAEVPGATMIRARLKDARLLRTDLSNADLSFADLTGANLTGAVLDRANLLGAKLTLTQLKQARSFRGARNIPPTDQTIVDDKLDFEAS